MRKRRKIESHVRDPESHDRGFKLEQNVGHITTEDLIKSLRFDQIDDRFVNIKPCLARTCRWLLQSPQYVDWLNPAKLHDHYGFFWIRGKPGCGKSTLTKFAFLELNKNIKVISFFFNARGTYLEKSTAGLYRSLLVQLLDMCSHDQVWTLPSLTHRSADQLSTNCEMLKQMFSQVLQTLGQQDITVVIDVLDESDEDEIRDMIRFFENISEDAVPLPDQGAFRVLLSSRHYLHITMKRCANMILEDQQGHSQDIEKYLESELKVTGRLAEEIRTEMQERASGIFMWIVLVVQILNKAFDRGQEHILRKKLREIPDDLNELLRSILSRDHEDLNTTQLCLQWILYAKPPMKPEELYYAILCGIDQSDGDPDESFLWSRNTTPTESIDRFIINYSKGLAEVTKSKNRNVQFIHQSVRDFLLKENGMSQVWPDLVGNPTGLSNDRLKECCSSYLKSDILSHLNISDPLPLVKTAKARSLRKRALRKFPFLEYALCNIIVHANDAQAEGVGQEHFLEEYEHVFYKWVVLNNSVEKYQIRRYPIDIDLKYIFAERNCPRLIELILRHGPATFFSNGRFGNYIFAAIANDHHEVFETLVKRDSRMHPHSCLFPYPGVDTLSFLVKHGKDTLVQRFLSIYVVDDVMESTHRRNIFEQAVAKGSGGITKFLLDRGLDVNAPCGKYCNAPEAAIKMGRKNIVKMLLDRGVDINAHVNKTYGSALAAAAASPSYGGSTAVVKLLLERDADINAKGGKYGSVLQTASRFGCKAIIELLLDRGAIKGDVRDEVLRTLALETLEIVDTFCSGVTANAVFEITEKFQCAEYLEDKDACPQFPRYLSALITADYATLPTAFDYNPNMAVPPTLYTLDALVNSNRPLT